MSEPVFTALNSPMAALTECESLVVRTYRKILLGNRDCPAIARDFALLYGSNAVDVYMTFCTLLSALAYASRRPLRVGHPGCAWLTGDERQLLALIAAAQVDDIDSFEAHLRWLTHGALRAPPTIALTAFATALSMHGQVVPQTKTAAPVNDPAPPIGLRLVAS